MTLTAERKQQIIDIARDLVRVKSLAGHEAGVAKVVIDAMRALGYDDVRVDALGNVIGTLTPSPSPSEGEGDILFDSHIDTVEAAGRWTKDPFGGEVSAGRLWGRGASDMKGALAACLCGAAYARDDGRLTNTVWVSASVSEEQIEGLALADVLAEYRPSRVVICESTQLKLAIGGRGRAEVFLTVEGVPAHASTPHLGVNALKQAARLILALDDWKPPHDPVLGYGIFEPTEIISSPFPSVSVLPDRCRIRCDRRLLAGETERDVLDPIHGVIEQLRVQDARLDARAEIDTETITTYTGAQRTGLKFQPAWKMDPDNGFIRAARAALGDPAISTYSFCTNAARSAGMLGIPTLGFGPGREEYAHIADEYCELDQLWGGAEGYFALCGL